MVAVDRKQLAVLEFPNISEIQDIRHGVFARHGGMSRGAYESLNISLGIGDEEKTVLKNRRIISAYLQMGVLAFARQVHGKNVLVIDAIPPSVENPSFFTVGTGDALITNLTGVGLVIQVADCQAVMMADPAKRVIANVHVGWRGNTWNIVGQTINVMRNRFDCDPSKLHVGIGPSLGPCCAEFVNYKTEIPKIYWQYKDTRHRFDLWRITTQQLAAAGVDVKNISVSGVCTKCHSDVYFSYRAKKLTGRFASVIALC
jgi:YfiH family protein